MNEDSVWYGGPVNRNNPDAKKHLPTIRHLLQEGKVKEAQRLAELALSGIPDQQRHYAPLGDLYLRFDHKDVRNYKRVLQLDYAIASVLYQSEGVTYTREFFSSFPAKMMVVNLTADHPGSISFTAKLTRNKGKGLDQIGIINKHVIMRGNGGGKVLEKQMLANFKNV